MTKIRVTEPHKVVEYGEIRNGVMHRTTYTPGQDISSAPDAVQDAAAEHWTPEVVAAYEAVSSPPPPPPATKVSKARIALFLHRHDTSNSTALKSTMEQIIASDPEAQILYESVVDLEIDRGGTRTIWDAVRAQTGTDLTVEDVFEGAAALKI